MILSIAGIHNEKKRNRIFPFKCGTNPIPFNGIPAVRTERSGINIQTVIMILKTVFMKPSDEAEYLTMKIDRTGQAVVGNYSYDIARSKQRKATSMARNLGFPLVINVEPAE